MKTKTTMAALLLAAVMVTPSYGATEVFLSGADAVEKDGREAATYSAGFFTGFCTGAVADGHIYFPRGASYGQLYTVVARYIYNHPEHHHLSDIELIKRASKEAWPNENKHVFFSR